MMQNVEKLEESLPPEVQEVMRSLVSALRAVKLYPPNNPLYSQSVKKSYETLYHFFEIAPECHIGVQKTFFTYLHTPLGRDARLDKAVAQDLFSKGVREIVFKNGMEEEELLDLFRTLSLSTEELAMKDGVASVLWEKGATHIKVTEAGLDEVITTKTESPDGVLGPATTKEDARFASRRLVLDDLMTDPTGFGAGMVQLAKETCGNRESVEDRLFSLYQEAGRTIQEEHDEQSDTLFQGLAQSILSLEPVIRDGMIAGKLYGDLDSERASGQDTELVEQAPNELHEILTGRFSNAWTLNQVSTLLKKSSSKSVAPVSPSPSIPADLDASPIPQELHEIVKDLADYTQEDMATLNILNEGGTEQDIIEASLRTLIFLLPLVKNPHHAEPEKRDISLFSSAVRQLEDIAIYLLQKKDYDLAAIVMRAFRMPVDRAFRQRLAEAVKKTANRAVIAAAIGEMRESIKGTPEYRSIYAYLSALERETTEVLLELLADEGDRSARAFLIDVLRDVGKNQIMFIGERISDKRWYFVRNIVSILGDTKADQAIPFLHRAADHKDVRIRREVVKGLVSIGGKKAAGLLAKFLYDKDGEIQLTAIRGLSGIHGVGTEEERTLVKYLKSRPIRRKNREGTLEAIRALAKIGSRETGEFLQGYIRIRWWKPRKLQKELRAAAVRAAEEIKRREHGGRASR